MSGILTHRQLRVADEAARSKHGLDFSLYFNHDFRQWMIESFVKTNVFTWKRHICIEIYVIQGLFEGLEAQKRVRTVATARTRDAASYWNLSKCAKYKGKISVVGENDLRGTCPVASVEDSPVEDGATVVVNENMADGFGVGYNSSAGYAI